MSHVNRILMAAAVSLLVLPGVAAERSSPHVSGGVASSDAANRLVDALETLSRRGNVAFVAEGEPVMVPPTPPDLQNLAALALPDAVAKVADAYDYQAERSGNVFVLTKRYAAPNDLPEVTLEECRLALRTAIRIADLYNPHVPPEDAKGVPVIETIARLLTREQIAAMDVEGSGGRGLPVAELSPEQRAEVWRIARHLFLRPTDIFETALASIEAVARQDVAFQFKRFNNLDVLGYETAPAKNKEPSFVPLATTRAEDLASLGATITVTDKHGNVVPPPKETTTPTDASLPPGNAISLRRVAQDLTARTGSPACSVEEPLAVKSITLVGAQKASSLELMEALAKAYGLRVVRQENGTLLLTYRRVPRVSNIAELPAAVRQAYPEPLLRALDARMNVERNRQETENSQRKRPTGLPERRLTLGQYAVAARALRLTAARRLRALIEPKLRASEDARVLLSALGEAEHKALAVALAADALASIAMIGDNPVPPYIAHFDAADLTGGIKTGDDGAPRFSILFNIRNPQTGYSTGGRYRECSLR